MNAKAFWPLFRMQLRDKLDFSWTKTKKGIIQKAIFTPVAFLFVAALAFLLVYLLASYYIIYKRDVIDIFVIFLTFFGLLNIGSIALSLTKSLFCAEDNKVLATFPASSGTVFFSKIAVYAVFQFKRDLTLFVPITLGLFAYAFTAGLIPLWTVFWVLIPLLFFSVISIMFGAFLSIPLLYVYQLFRNFPIIQVVLFALAIPSVVGIMVYGIGQIPKDIDLANDWLPIRANILAWINSFQANVKPMAYITSAMLGELGGNQTYVLTGMTMLYAGAMLLVAVMLAVLVLILIKPFYFRMMSKTFELRKNAKRNKKNSRPVKPGLASFIKEMRLSIRDFGISGTFIAVYVLAPVLLYFMDRLFGAMATSLSGDAMVIAFNLLLMVLPYLVSNSVVATLRSRQGRCVYMDKTTPMESTTPILVRGGLMFILSVPSIVAECFVFADFTGYPVWSCVSVGLCVLLLQFGHIFHALAMDFMNPQNDLYDMDGESKTNKNEVITAVTGFVTAGVFAGLGLAFFIECANHGWNMDSMWIRLLLISVAFFLAQAMLFVWKVRAYYYEK